MKETSISNKLPLSRALGYLVTVLLLIGFDQWTKWWVLEELSGGKIVTVLPDILQFRYLQNTGAAFSVLTGRTLLLSALTAVILVVAVALLLLGKVPGKAEQIAVVLMIAGGAGNLIDRLARHYVVDFIEVLFTNFAVFNFADCCVTIGAVLLILFTLLSFGKDAGKSEE